MAYILLVDDEPDARQLLRLMLKKYDQFEFRDAGNGMEALEAVRVESPKLILLDLMMPEMDGRTFLVESQTIDQMQNVPVIIFTALGPDHAQLPEVPNPIKFFQKGKVTPNNLRSTVDEMLN